MEAFFRDLGIKIQEALQKDISKILKDVGDERIYAAALVTDSDCITLYLVVNTYEYMRKRDNEYIGILHLSEEQSKKIKEGTASIVKWVPDEWGYSVGKESELTQISKLLYEKEKSNPEEYAEKIDQFLETVTFAFKALVDAKSFGEHSEDIAYFLSMSDDDRMFKIENYSARLLNTEKVYKEFLKRDEILKELYS